MRSILLALAFAASAAPALAHEGDHTHMTAADAARHALNSPDHLMLIGLIAAILALPLARLARSRTRR